MRIAIRADGGTIIGLGHIMRCLVLAQKLSHYHEVFFCCRIDKPLTNKYMAGINKIIEEGFKIKYVNENDIINELKGIQADVLFTDSYDVNEEYFNKTKSMFKITGYMDDKNLYKFNVDFIVNQNINALDQRYCVPKFCKLFLGPEYLLLRDEFVKKAKNEYNSNVRDIMVTVGGADPFYVTYKMLNMIRDEKYTYHVIIGKSFEYLDNLKKLSVENSNIKLYFNANMAEIMKRCDIAISACGSTLYELSLCGVPTIGIIIGEDQVGIANKMNSDGLILNLGWYYDLNKQVILNAINYLNNYNNRMSIIERQKIINASGASRLCSELNNFFMKE